MDTIKVIAFDADDTLWHNELYFREYEDKFCNLLKDYLPYDEVAKLLFQTEMKNLSLYGYGIKSFMLSMLETCLIITGEETNAKLINKIVGYGKDMLNKPVKLLEGTEHVLDNLYKNYKLILATKGDLLDQERKLRDSKLENYFCHVSIMSDKQENDYKKLLQNIGCKPENFLMIGNSLKSDILPVLSIGGSAIHVPYYTTWAYELVDEEVKHCNFKSVKYITDILEFFSSERGNNL